MPATALPKRVRSALAHLARPSRPALALVAIVIAFLALGVLDWDPRTGGVKARYWGVFSGDEPHYMVVVHSVLYDGDFNVKDDYTNAYKHGLEAGAFFRGKLLNHHTYIVDPETGKSRRWTRVYNKRMLAHCPDRDCVPFALRPKHPFPDLDRTIEVPSHPPAFPSLLAYAIWPFYPTANQVELYAALVLLLVGLATAVLTFVVGRRSGLSPWASVLAVALLVLATQWVAYSKGYFAETSVGLTLLLAIWAMDRGRPVAAALAVSVAIWFKPVFVIVGFAWILERLMAKDFRTAFKLAAVIGICGLGLIAFNHELLGRVVVAGSGGVPGVAGHGGPKSGGGDGASNGAEVASQASWLWEWVTHRSSALSKSLVQLLSDKRYGVVLFVPWTVLAAWYVLRNSGPGRESASWWRLIGLPCAMYAVVLMLFSGGNSGYCIGPRYWVPFFPWFALAVAHGFDRGGRWERIVIAVVCLGTALTTVPQALASQQVWSKAPTVALRRMLPHTGEPIGKLIRSDRPEKEFRRIHGKGWVPADGRRSDRSSMYYLLTGKRRPDTRVIEGRRVVGPHRAYIRVDY